MFRGTGPDRSREHEAGFTLVELMAVIAIIATLALLTLPFTATALGQAKAARSASELRDIQAALEMYHIDHGFYPNKIADLKGTYLRDSFSFETPHSTAKKRLYYLYAVDDNHDEKAQAYILADPGAAPAAAKHVGAAGALPNGLKPGAKTYAYAWACPRSASTTLTVDSQMDCTTANPSLWSYRTDLRTEG